MTGNIISKTEKSIMTNGRIDKKDDILHSAAAVLQAAAFVQLPLVVHLTVFFPFRPLYINAAW